MKKYQFINKFICINLFRIKRTTKKRVKINDKKKNWMIINNFRWDELVLQLNCHEVWIEDNECGFDFWLIPFSEMDLHFPMKSGKLKTRNPNYIRFKWHGTWETWGIIKQLTDVIWRRDWLSVYSNSANPTKHRAKFL